MEDKLKIGIDLLNIWENFEVYKEVVKDLSLNTNEIDLYIITTETNDDLILSARTLLGIDTNKVFKVDTNEEISNTISELEIDIYLTGISILVVELVNNDITRAILVDMIPDRYNMQPKWVTNLQFWMKQLTKDNMNEEDC